MTATDSSAQAIANELCEKHGMTGVGVGLVQSQGQPEVAVAGLRNKARNDLIGLDDFWHLGSIGKSITSVLVAKLFEETEAELDTALADVLPEMPMHEDWRASTLYQLMTSSSGLPSNFPLAKMRNYEEDPAKVTELRRSLIEQALAKPPKSKPGTAFRYSNLGYTLLGYLAETYAGVPFQTLVAEQVLTPLDLRFGFGPPPGDNHPHGHRVLFGFSKAVDPRAGIADNPAIIAPAGRIHMDLASLLRYGQAHLAGERGEHELLKPETWRQLHAPHLQDYGCGWVHARRKGKGFEGNVYWHDGSNTLWYAMVILAPDIDAVVGLVTNHGAHRKAGKIFSTAAESLLAGCSS